MFLLASFPFGSALGIPVRIHWSAPAGLLIWSAFSFHDVADSTITQIALHLLRRFAVAAVLAGVVLIHELGHALTARTWGVRTDGIYLHIFGGMTLTADSAFSHLTPRRAMVMIAAGPASNLLCCLVALLLGLTFEVPVLTSLLGLIAALNLVMGLFNLLPIWPLDGGRLLLASLTVFQISRRLSNRITLIVALSFGGALAYMAWILEDYWMFSILLIVLTAAVALLAEDGVEADAYSAGSQIELDSKTAGCPDVQPLFPAHGEACDSAFGRLQRGIGSQDPLILLHAEMSPCDSE